MKFLYLPLCILLFFFVPGLQAADDLRASVAADYEANLESLFLHFH